MKKIITKDDLFRLANQAQLNLSDQEATLFVGQIETILNYAEELQQIKTDVLAENVRAINVFREDVAAQNNAQEVLAQAPKTDGTYFVVPKILD